MKSSRSDIVVINATGGGGITHYTFGLCNGLAGQKQKVALVSTQSAYELEAFPRAFEIKHLIHDKYQSRETNFDRLMKRLSPERTRRRQGTQVGEFLRQAAPRAVHQQWPTEVTTEPLFWDAMRHKAGGSFPLIYTAHNVFPHDATPQSERAFRELYRHTQAIIMHGEALRQRAIAQAGVAPEKAYVVPHGHYHFLADQFETPTMSQARAALGLEDEDRVALFFGFVREYKGLDVLLLAMERLLRDRKGGPIKLLVAGMMPNQQTWEASVYGGLTRALKISDAVKVHAQYIPMSEMGRYFAAADVACFPYRDGSQSGALQLAYAFSKPVIVARVGSLPEAVVEGETGLLVEPEDPQSLTDALIQMLSDPEKARQMGERGRQWSGDVCSWDAIAARTLEIYQTAGAQF